MGKPKFIDNDKEHFQILAQMGDLDDLEDWKLYSQMMVKYVDEYSDAETQYHMGKEYEKQKPLDSKVENHIVENRLYIKKEDLIMYRGEEEKRLIIRYMDNPKSVVKFHYYYISEDKYHTIEMMMSLADQLSHQENINNDNHHIGSKINKI